MFFGVGEHPKGVTLNRWRPVCFVHAGTVHGLDRVNSVRLGEAWLEFGQRESLSSGSVDAFLAPRAQTRWFSLCMFQGSYLLQTIPFLLHLFLEADAGMFLTYREHSTEKFFTAASPHLNLHTLVAWSLDVGTGRGHCFWLPVFFYQANDLLLAVDASQADYGRTWFADCLRGTRGGGLLREGTNRRGHEPSVTL